MATRRPSVKIEEVSSQRKGTDRVMAVVNVEAAAVKLETEVLGCQIHGSTMDVEVG
ncbi:hypothetical protein SAMD00019534_073170 [Acytostelium subglobosum LB1]|uniref:hypothetical protein n=1 Tax=Acytostelium subglobosum LB1 TaxID=1410327 RepID=UPI000644D62B|nr:hypothetical protein SAMD00019534_073170 [Acytostelium subglobosum LB1]GAM24142.1 hypothetical protein SAMD00019534_073170 [Acytostelium subglobosum LB1]|eukprot:XP_012753178.1 hypothetical protein SAMD00019534_073170 [Acytostelium subglobosum LB1]